MSKRINVSVRDEDFREVTDYMKRCKNEGRSFSHLVVGLIKDHIAKNGAEELPKWLR